MFALKLLLFLVTILQVKGDCPTGSCEKISLDVHRDAVQHSEFVGHVFHNSVTLNPVQCYTWCIQDCRCLSINYKENNEEKYCELNEGNQFTNESSLKDSPGSNYYTLRREIHRSKEPCVDEVTWTNGCCENNPCLNEGTCNQICEPASVRYNCSCPVPFVGKHCEIQLRKSCQDYKAAGVNESGLYRVIDDSNRIFKVFCDFDSERFRARLRVESDSIIQSCKQGHNEDCMQVLTLPVVLNEISGVIVDSGMVRRMGVVFSDYTDSGAVSGEMPNWQAYLIRPSYLAWLGNQSTHWRATCRYDTDGVVYRDYMRTSLADFDIRNIQEPVIAECHQFEIINIRGYECVSCTAPLWNRKGITSLCTDSSYNICEFSGNQGNVVNSEDNFGLYGKVNPAFRCTSNPDSTTQFWIGGQQ
ncbi:hypothetical protein ACROYT_G020641 [Oculina patagonica]